jgi:hypothetical protein
MSQENFVLKEISDIYKNMTRSLERIASLDKRISKLEQESNAKDELIERLKEENKSLMRENIDMRQNPNHWRF